MFTFGTLTLPSPSYGDMHRVNTHAVIRQSRSGVLKYYRGDLTQNVYKYDFIFKNCAATYPLLTQLKDYILANAGKEISWTDHLGVTRTGYMITESPEIVTEHSSKYNIILEFLVKV